MLVVARELLVIWGDCVGSTREPRDRWRHLSTPWDSSRHVLYLNVRMLIVLSCCECTIPDGEQEECEARDSKNGHFRRRDLLRRAPWLEMAVGEVAG